MSKLEFQAEYRAARCGYDTQCEAVQRALADGIDSQWSRHQARLCVARELFIAKQRAASATVKRDILEAGHCGGLRGTRGKEELWRRVGAVLKIREAWRCRVRRWTYGNPE